MNISECMLGSIVNSLLNVGTDLPGSSQTDLEAQAEKPTALIPIRVEFETDSHRIRDCFVWNLNEELITPEVFARTFCTDLDLRQEPYAEIVANQIRAQLEEHEGVASMYLGADADISEEEDESPGDEVNECRVILSVSASPILSPRF